VEPSIVQQCRARECSAAGRAIIRIGTPVVNGISGSTAAR
jgi:hypothetical protein